MPKSMPNGATKKTKSAHRSSNETPASGFLIARSGEINSPTPAALPQAAKEVRSAPRLRPLLFAGVIVASAAALLLPFWLHSAATDQWHIAGRTLTLEIAATEPAQARGLGGRTGLPDDRGMLFVFDRAGHECFWMKDMKFSIDMVFVSSNKQVVHIQPNVLPRTYPETFCADDVRYVIELAGGQAGTLGLHVGRQLNF